MRLEATYYDICCPLVGGYLILGATYNAACCTPSGGYLCLVATYKAVCAPLLVPSYQ